MEDVTTFCLSSGKMYPNPANTLVNIELPKNDIKGGQVVFLNTVGLEIKRDTFVMVDGKRILTCDVSTLNRGLYFVQIIDDKGSVVDVKRLAIE